MIDKFENELKEIFGSEGLKVYKEKEYSQIINLLIKDIRHLVKTLNNIRFGAEYAKVNLAIHDYIVIKTIQSTRSSIYKIIMENRHILEVQFSTLRKEEVNTPELEELILSKCFNIFYHVNGSTSVSVRWRKKEKDLNFSKKIKYPEN